MLHFNSMEEVYNLLDDKKKEVINAIKNYYLRFFSKDPISNELKSKQQKRIITCPRCGDSEHIIGGGKLKDKQRYICKTCGRKFVETANTAIYWIHKRDQFMQYIDCMLEAKSIRMCAALVGIAKTTSFTWRHKILSSLPEILNDFLSDIVEVSAFQLDYSEKGTDIPIEKEENMDIPTTIVAAADKDGNVVMQMVGRGDKIEEEVKDFAEKRLDKDATICVEKGEISKILKKMEYDIYSVDSGKGKLLRESPLHTNFIQNTIFNFVSWMSRFKQVATKYLQNYLNWFVFLEKITKMVDPEKVFLKKSMQSDEAWRRRRYLKKHLILVE